MHDATRSRRVLLIEDDGDLRQILAERLRQAGFEVIEAANGADALARARQEEAPDAIILDLMMPVMDGWEFRVHQRRDPELAATPVVVLSASSAPEAAAIDADLHLQKPPQLDVLLEGLERVLSLRERQQAAAEAAHADRLASLATLAAGLAHEINNPLGALLGSVELAEHVARRQPHAEASALALHLKTIREAAEHIRELVRDVSGFARHDEPCEPLDPREVLEAALNMSSAEIEQRAELVSDHQPLPLVVASRQRLLQVFLNLLSNAVQALDAGRRGTIRTRTYTAPNGDAVVEISDTGRGIADSHLGRIFDPFFTTKPRGQGSGLGLSISHALVQRFGGRIGVESELGRGATFRVVLPAASPD